MDSPDADDTWLTAEEADAQLRAFVAVPAHWANAKSLSRMAASGLIGWSGEDLLAEAMVRLLAGQRVWRRGVHPLVTLKTIMRSIADGEFKKQKSGPIDTYAVVEDGTPYEEEDLRDLAVAARKDLTLRVADCHSQMEYIEKLVEDDEDCWMLVQLWAEGSRGKMAAEELGWDAKKHDAVRQRLIRSLEPLRKLRSEP